jgi:hypothetical protein
MEVTLPYRTTYVPHCTGLVVQKRGRAVGPWLLLAIVATTSSFFFFLGGYELCRPADPATPIVDGIEVRMLQWGCTAAFGEGATAWAGIGFGPRL